MIDIYRSASPDQESRDAAEGATRFLSECIARLALGQGFFLLIKAVADKDECPNDGGCKAARDILHEYTGIGHGKLRSDQIETLLDSRKDISQLCQDFHRKLDEDAPLAEEVCVTSRSGRNCMSAKGQSFLFGKYGIVQEIVLG